ncbi:MAG: hypothetical protein ACYCYF_14045, partial [Anaerolineae bacterium]
QIWQVLIGAAHCRQTITYEQLGELIGTGGEAVLAYSLSRVVDHCATNSLPPLTALVVDNSGEPGAGLAPVTNIHADREQVFAFGWYAPPPRKIADFAA